MDDGPLARRCPWCGQVAGTVSVHGHVQCAACGINVDPCCGGETAREGAQEEE